MAFWNFVKYGLQRIRRGYCDADCRDMDVWFLSVVPDMLRKQADSFTGCPTAFMHEWYELNQGDLGVSLETFLSGAEQEINRQKCMKAWKEKLYQMAADFDRANLALEDFDDQWYGRAEACKDRAFGEFVKWFFCLWV